MISVHKFELELLKESEIFKKNEATLKAITTFVLPALLAVLAMTKEYFTPDIEFIFWALVLIFVAAQIFLGIRLMVERPTFVQLIEESEENKKKIKNYEKPIELLKSEISIFSTMYAINIAQCSMVHTTHLTGVDSAERIIETLGEIITLFSQKRDVILGFEGDDIWDFSLFLLDEDERELKCVWRIKDDRHPSSGDPRVWKIGEGHVGKAFADNDDKITSDMTDPSTASLLKMPGKVRPYDETIYCSMISAVLYIPDGSSDHKADELNRGRPIGVLAVSSSVPGRLQEEHKQFLRQLAATASMLLEAFEKNSGIEKPLTILSNELIS